MSTVSFKSTIATLPTGKGEVLNPNQVAPISPPSSVKKTPSIASSDDVALSTGPVEDYNGGYVFTPIKEWQVSRDPVFPTPPPAGSDCTDPSFSL